MPAPMFGGSSLGGPAQHPCSRDYRRRRAAGSADDRPGRARRSAPAYARLRRRLDACGAGRSPGGKRFSRRRRRRPRYAALRAGDHPPRCQAGHPHHPGGRGHRPLERPAVARPDLRHPAEPGRPRGARLPLGAGRSGCAAPDPRRGRPQPDRGGGEAASLARRDRWRPAPLALPCPYLCHPRGARQEPEGGGRVRLPPRRRAILASAPARVIRLS